MTFSDNNIIQGLLSVSHELTDIGSAIGLLSWDQEVMMPPKGATGRALALATLSGIYHEKLIDPKVGELLEQAKSVNNLSVFDLALVREMGREYEKAIKLPTTLVEALSQTTSEAYQAWSLAKSKNDFSVFAPALQRVLDLRISAASLLQKPGQSLYDTMIDDYEEGLTETEIQDVFMSVRTPLVQLVQQLTKKTSLWSGEPDDVGSVDWPTFTRETLTRMGYDWDAGRLDPTAHPFEISLGSGDVRITTWQDGKDWKEMLMAAMHETGHGLYELGIDPLLERTHLAGGQGLVLHESQSRLWENLVGRSRLFWKNYPESWWQALNKVSPTPVRVLADEATYGLHIILRFEIERDLISGKIQVQDLPTVWNVKMKELLGIEPKSDAEGVLQDVHWSHGSFGYFPTYFLGTMTAAQIWKKVEGDLDVNTMIEKHDFGPLRDWLKEKIHRHGKVYLSKDLIKQVTGEGLNPRYFLEYLERKFL